MMEKPLLRNFVARNSVKVSSLPGSLLTIIAQFCAMKWRKQKQSLGAFLHNGIPIGNPVGLGYIVISRPNKTKFTEVLDILD